ncbi:MAG: DUF4352 domain-containing protein [Acutalibacteraceae bacterium]
MQPTIQNALRTGICLLAACALLSGCSAAKPESAAESTAPASPTPQAAATPEPVPEAVPAGETGALGDWEITANSLTTQETYSMSDSEYNLLYYEPDEGSIYYVVSLSVKNLGKQSDQLLTSFRTQQDTAYLIYNGEYEYPPSDLLGAQTTLVGAAVNPLSTRTGDLVFSVPKDISGEFSLRIVKDGETLDMALPAPTDAQESSTPAEAPGSPESAPAETAAPAEREASESGGIVYDPDGPTDYFVTSAAGNPLPFGETASFGPWKIRMDGHYTEAIPGEPMTHYHFFAMSITNTSAETLAVSPSAAGDNLQFTLIENNTVTFQPEESGSYDSLYDVSVAPGETVSGTLRFTVEDSVQQLFTMQAVCGGETTLLEPESYDWW